MGHQGLVYDLHWSPKDTLLLSASADCTACLWDTGGEKSHLLQVRLCLSSHFDIKFPEGLILTCTSHKSLHFGMMTVTGS